MVAEEGVLWKRTSREYLIIYNYIERVVPKKKLPNKTDGKGGGMYTESMRPFVRESSDDASPLCRSDVSDNNSGNIGVSVILGVKIPCNLLIILRTRATLTSTGFSQTNALTVASSIASPVLTGVDRPTSGREGCEIRALPSRYCGFC